MTKFLVLAALLAGCGDAYYSNTDYEVTLDAWSVSLSPDTEKVDTTRKVARMWSDATGWDIHIAEGGIPVHHVPVEDLSFSDCVKDGVPSKCRRAGETSYQCPVTGCAERWKVEGIWLSAELSDKVALRTLLHEMGHALGGFTHTETGIMASKAQGYTLDDDAIDSVCERILCISPQPE